MFFPCLEVLKKEKEHEQTIDIFDWWLGTRRQNTLGSLNPLQFALDCGIKIEEALRIFSHSVFDQRIRLLKRKFVIYCPACSHKITILPDRPKGSCTCANCTTAIPSSVLDDYTEIRFELLKPPQEPNFNSRQAPRGVMSGKAPSLLVSDFRNYGDDEETRRLFDLM